MMGRLNGLRPKALDMDVIETSQETRESLVNPRGEITRLVNELLENCSLDMRAGLYEWKAIVLRLPLETRPGMKAAFNFVTQLSGLHHFQSYKSRILQVAELLHVS